MSQLGQRVERLPVVHCILHFQHVERKSEKVAEPELVSEAFKKDTAGADAGRKEDTVLGRPQIV